MRLQTLKQGAGQQILNTHISGIIVHGRGKYFFIDNGRIHHDTNLNLSCLMKIQLNELQDCMWSWIIQ